MTERTTIMGVVEKKGYAELLQEALADVNRMDGCVISYVLDDGTPVTIWVGLKSSEALGLLELAKFQIIQKCRRTDEPEK